MKSKIILNILIIYFLILSTVLLIQISSKKIDAIEPLSSEITSEDKLKNSVVLAIDSPVVIVNEKQYLIDEKDSTLVPIILKGKVYIPVKFLKTAFGADISFSKQTKETIVRLNNKALIFSNNGTSIRIIDNTTEEKLDIDTEPKIINDRFYIPLRSFADIFEKEIFYNDDLIIISNIKDLFDPIEEIDILKELEKQVKYLPIVGTEENLKYILKEQTNYDYQNNNLINIEQLDIMLEQNKPVIIYKTDNFNIYATKGFIEVYFVTEENKEEFSFKLEKINNNIKDIQITNDRFIASYLDNSLKTIIYDISDKKNIKTLDIIENNGNFYKNIIDDNNLYIISKINTYKDKSKLPYFLEYVYENDVLIDIVEDKVTLDKIHFFPDMNDSSYTLISYVNLYELDKSLSANVYLGMGENIVINKDIIYVITSNGNNNNLYQFKATLDGIEYIKRKFIRGKFKNAYVDDEKQLLKIELEDNFIYLDDNLIQR